MSDIVAMARLAGRDERFSTGQLYLDLADEIERLREDLRIERLARFRSEEHFAELSAQLKAAQGAKSPKLASDT